jgi:hypothetical protein
LSSGEDTYFIREKAMGVADGVGGWAGMKHPGAPLLFFFFFKGSLLLVDVWIFCEALADIEVVCCILRPGLRSRGPVTDAQIVLPRILLPAFSFLSFGRQNVCPIAGLVVSVCNP